MRSQLFRSSANYLMIMLLISVVFPVRLFAVSGTFYHTPADVPLTVTAPSATACQSPYDSYYESEPGVYAYWALCETGTNPVILDYSSNYSFAGGTHGGTLNGGVASPLPDAETAIQTASGDGYVANSGIPLYGNSGVVALWINTDANPSPVTAAMFSALSGNSGIAISTFGSGGSLCFTGTYTNTSGAPSNVQQCGYSANAWHRVVMGWGNGFMSLSIDGIPRTVSGYNGSLDSGNFTYKLFPGTANSGKQMTLSRVTIASQGWSGSQVAQDYNPQISLPAPTQLVFGAQPTGGTAGISISPAITVFLADSQNRIVKTSSGSVTVSLANAGNAGLSGTATVNAVNGQATFSDLVVTGQGAGYQLVATSQGLPLIVSNPFAIVPGKGTTSGAPASGGCGSTTDSFYGAEPGVLAFWPMCEQGRNPVIHDLVGRATVPSNQITGVLSGGAAGPLADGETAILEADSNQGAQGQPVYVNGNGGVIAAWLNAGASSISENVLTLNSIGGRSGLALGLITYGNNQCYYANYLNSAGVNSQAQVCGFAPNTWHRVVFGWGGGFMSISVDGNVDTVAQYQGGLDNLPFVYSLFPRCCNTGASLALAKVLVGNQGWNGQQVAADFTPPLPSSTSSAPPSVPVTDVKPHLVFGSQPGNVLAGYLFTPVVSVAVADSTGATLSSANNTITLTLLNANGASLSGTPVLAASNGVVSFNDLNLVTPGSNYQLLAQSPGLAPAISTSFSINPFPVGSSYTVPPVNLCNSKYDIYYKNEPGVYAFWGLCEAGYNPEPLFDDAGQWNEGAWGSHDLRGGAPGPVNDGETAIQAVTATSYSENQNIPLNNNGGTIAEWINADAGGYPVSTLWLSGIGLKSILSVTVFSSNGSICYGGNFQDSNGQNTTISHCGYVPNTWHRVAFVWTAQTLSLAVDGNIVATGTHTGLLDNNIFFYRMFPQCCDTGKQMTLAKMSLANQAWSAAQLALDFNPAFITPPTGGLYVTDQQLGTIHRDVMGYADANEDLSQGWRNYYLQQGLSAAGVTSVHYAGGAFGISADGQDWQNGGISCTRTPGVTAPAYNLSTNNNIDSFVANVAGPLNLHMGYTVNYGSNPPFCNAGGDPTVNGANLVNYVNNIKHYGFKYFEIGNEQVSLNTAIDLYPNPFTVGSYITNQTNFYNLMKAQDPSIKIGVPIAGAGVYFQQAQWDVPLMNSAKYDAVVFHTYPIQDPVSDGDTLYQDRAAASTNIHGPLLTVQTELLNAGKDPGSLWITEWSAAVAGGPWSKQSLGPISAIFATTELAEYMQAGVQFATWWAQGGANVCQTLNYDYTDENAYAYWECGNTSLVYTGPVPNFGEVNVGLKPSDLFPAARGFQVLSQSGFVTEGEHMLRVQADGTNSPWLEGYAATHNGQYAVILINRDRDTVHTVPVQFAGKSAGGSVSQWSYGRAQYDHTYFGDWSQGTVTASQGAWNGAFQATLQPWSVNVFVLNN